jgi:ABC-type nitrate/sulfonate/bicarbonate transport system substrate-binding protein
VPFTIVASAGVYDSRSIFSGSITLKDSPLHFGADANGATFGVPSLSDIGHDAFCAWVDQHGGSSSTLRFVEIPFTLSAAAVEQQRVVAAELAAPGLTAALDTGKFRLLPIYNAIAPTFLLSACFTTTEFAAKNTDALRRFARVVTAAGAYANGHHAETVPMMAKLSGIPADQLLHMPRALQGVKVTPELIQPVIAAAAKYGSLKNSFPAQELIDADVIA